MAKAGFSPHLRGAATGTPRPPRFTPPPPPHPRETQWTSGLHRALSGPGEMPPPVATLGHRPCRKQLPTLHVAQYQGQQGGQLARSRKALAEALGQESGWGWEDVDVGEQRPGTVPRALTGARTLRGRYLHDGGFAARWLVALVAD